MEYDLAVVGLGPAGLAASINAAKNGKKVVVFTDREEYVRQQRVSVTRETINFLKRFYDEKDPDDVKFFKRMENEPYENRSLVQTKDLESYLYRKLENFSKLNPGFIEIVKSNKKKQSPGTVLKIGKNPNGRHFIETRAGAQFAFKHLFAADGAKHGTASMVERDLGKKITYKPHIHQEKNKYQAAVQLRLKPGVTPPKKAVSDPSAGLKLQMKEFKKLDWKEEFPPDGYVFANEKNTKFSFAGEIPEELFNIEDEVEKKEALKKWASCRIAAYYGIRPEDLEFKVTTKKEFSPKLEAKIKLQASAFVIELFTSDQAFILLDEDSVFGQGGDARRSPNFYLGHGLNDAIACGIAFANCIKENGEFDQFLYTEIIKNLDANLNLGLKGRAIAWQQKDLNFLINKVQIMFPDDNVLKTALGQEKQKIPLISNPDEYMKMKNEVTDLLLNKLLVMCNDHATYLQNIKDHPSKKTMGLVINETLIATRQLFKIIEDGKSQALPASEILTNFQTAVNTHKDVFKDNISTTQEKDFYSKILQCCGQTQIISKEFKSIFFKKSPPNYHLTEDSKEKLIEKLKRYIAVQKEVKEAFFGHSNTEKLEAAQALIQALDKNNTEYVDLEKHKAVLRDGPLGSLIREHVKSISEKNSVIGLLEDLQTKMPRPAPNSEAG